MPNQDELADQLLNLAREDLAAAKALNEAEGVSNSKSGFSAQQAVEKALKAVLATRGIDFPCTHNITLLMQLCKDAGFELPADLSDADRLTPYAAVLPRRRRASSSASRSSARTSARRSAISSSAKLRSGATFASRCCWSGSLHTPAATPSPR